MSSLVFLLFLIPIVFSGIGPPNWRNCAFCSTTITNANDYFGERVSSVSNDEFFAYFYITCPNYKFVSEIMMLVCEDMITNHHQVVFDGLRKKRIPQEICMNCGDCDQ